MCLIIHQRKGIALSRNDLADIYGRNGNGFGIMWSENGTLYTVRGVMDAPTMLATYAKYGAGRECVIHWRYATHGATNDENAHPFVIDGTTIAVMHNGMIDCGTPDSSMSDTWHLVTHVLGPIARDGTLFDVATIDVFSPLIGTGNKLVCMDETGRVAIYNRAQGVEYRGCWYSNTYAWSAPSHLMPVSKWSGKYWQPSTTTPPAQAPGTTVQQSLSLPMRSPQYNEAWDDVALYDDDNLPAELVEQVQRNGESGAMQWARDNEAEASEILHEWYGTRNDVGEDKRAEWLVEIVEAMR